MLTGIIATVAIILFLIFFIIYKRNMIVKLFTLNAAQPAGELTQQIERTADAAINRLEKQLAHLELLLEEADAKIAELDRKLQVADDIKTSSVTEELFPPDVATPNFSSGVDFTLPAENPFTLIAKEESLEEEPSVLEKDSKDPLSTDKRRLIISMSGQGYSATEIAKATGFGRGEVLLVLQLNKK